MCENVLETRFLYTTDTNVISPLHECKKMCTMPYPSQAFAHELSTSEEEEKKRRRETVKTEARRPMERKAAQ